METHSPQNSRSRWSLADVIISITGPKRYWRVGSSRDSGDNISLLVRWWGNESARADMYRTNINLQSVLAL